MATVDNAPGSHAAGALGGGGKGGGGGKRGGRGKGGPKGHYAGHKHRVSFDNATVAALEQSGVGGTREVKFIQEQCPVRRELVWRPDRETALNKHHTYASAVELQLRGHVRAEGDECSSCKRGSGPFGNGCVTFGVGDTPDGRILFGGSCANCFWGGQGTRCSHRVVLPSATKGKETPIYQDKDRSSTHLGSEFDLNSLDGLKDAITDMRRIERGLQYRFAQIDAGKAMPDVESESEEE